MRKADVRANSDELAANRKMNFLGLGLGQGTSMLSTQASVSNSGASSLSGISGNYLSQATTIGESNRSTMMELASSGAGYASGKGWI